MAAEIFEFIDCATISIQYQTTGLANVSFTVVSTEQEPGILLPVRDYTQLTFGGIDFKGFVTQLDSGIIPGSIPNVFEHRFSLIMTGCAADCPRG
ncbi:hypothetical protein LCGC14_1918520 [marine sediment metagenome]|uniref:Uncharacterized protein n=1 Tax=marine sediment metagenome TaxID=412755 RepID=A0A0F9FRA5_9ZZZZ